MANRLAADGEIDNPRPNSCSFPVAHSLSPVAHHLSIIGHRLIACTSAAPRFAIRFSFGCAPRGPSTDRLTTAGLRPPWTAFARVRRGLRPTLPAATHNATLPAAPEAYRPAMRRPAPRR